MISSVTQTNHFQSSYYKSLSSRLTTLSSSVIIDKQHTDPTHPVQLSKILDHVIAVTVIMLFCS